MGLDKLLSHVLVIGSLSVGSYNCDSSNPDPVSCKRDYDCKDNRICENEKCVEPVTTSGQTYTCESGSKMIVDICCPLSEINCSGERSGASSQKMYEKWVEECQEEVNQGRSSSQVHTFFTCSYDVCTMKTQPIKEKFKSCRSYLFQ